MEQHVGNTITLSLRTVEERPVNIVNPQEDIILRLATEYNKSIHRNIYDIFHDIINEDGFDINQVNSHGRTLLMQLTRYSRCHKFAAMLLAKGADVNLKDKYGNTFLHLCASNTKVDNIKTAELIINAGADINCQRHKGITPLFMACYFRNLNFVHLLLCYGADSSIPSMYALLPVNALSPRVGYEIQDMDTMDILCLYTFDTASCISLSVVVTAIIRDSFLLNKIITCRPKLICDREAIDYFCEQFKYFNYHNFTVFVENYEDVFQVLLERVDLFDLFQEALHSDWTNLDEISDIFDYLLESKYLVNMVQSSDPEQSNIFTSIVYVCSIDDNGFALQELQKTIIFMLSYGLGVTSDDLQSVYINFRNSELFRVLLHMDIVPGDEENNNPLVRLCYNPSLSVEDVLESYEDVSDLLGYFNNFKLKQICSRPCYADIVDRVRKMPNVSSLVELSRNVVRKNIVTRYGIKECKEFYCVLNELPIDVYSKRILALQQKLY